MEEFNEYGVWNSTETIEISENTSEQMFRTAKTMLQDLSPREFKIASIYIMETLHVMFAEECLVKATKLYKDKKGNYERKK